MKFECKLYKTFDSDLISLHDNGVNVPDLMKISLSYFVRGKMVYFITKECKPYDMTGHKRYIHLATDITDEESISFLKTQIKFRQRSAFLKSLVRASIISPQVGTFIRGSTFIKKENNRLNELIDTEPEYLENFTILDYDENAKRSPRDVDYYKDKRRKAGLEDITVKKPLDTKQAVNNKKSDEDNKLNNIFGDVSNLKPQINKENKKQAETEEIPTVENADTSVFEIDNDPFEENSDSIFSDSSIDDLEPDIPKNEENEENNNEDNDDMISSAFDNLLGG